MNTKLVLIVLFCVVVATYAKPAKKGGKEKGGKEKGGKGKEPFGLTKNALFKFCKGLNNGNITNVNETFNDVFTELTTVCADVQAYLDTLEDGDEPEVEAMAAKKKGGKEKGGKGKGGKGKGKGKGEDGDDNNDDEIDAVKALLGVCRAVQKVMEQGLPGDLPTELVDIFTAFNAQCVIADGIVNPTDEDAE